MQKPRSQNRRMQKQQAKNEVASNQPTSTMRKQNFGSRALLLFCITLALLLGTWQVMAAVAPQSLHRLMLAYTSTSADLATPADVGRLHLSHVQPTTAGQLKVGQSVIMRDGRSMLVKAVSQSPASPPSAPAKVASTTSVETASSSSDKGDWILAPNQLPYSSADGDIPPLPTAHSAQDPNFHPVQVQKMETVGDKVVLTCRNPETEQQEVITGKQGRDNVFTLKNPETANLPTSQIKDVEPGNLVATRNPQTG